jgi:hypothetical protein
MVARVFKFTDTELAKALGDYLTSKDMLPVGKYKIKTAIEPDHPKGYNLIIELEEYKDEETQQSP